MKKYIIVIETQIEERVVGKFKEAFQKMLESDKDGDCIILSGVNFKEIKVIDIDDGQPAPSVEIEVVNF